MRTPLLLRNAGAQDLVENFLVAAVGTILGVRTLLYLTGYPSIGGSRLHIAHMLWGGLLLVLALGILLSFLGAGARSIASVVGGIGFGLFIDEIGKFVTRDNDYFYRPAIALIYLVFVLLYLGFRRLHGAELSPAEAVANALELMQEALRHDMDPEEWRRAETLLERSAADDPMAAELRRALAGAAITGHAHAGPLERARRTLRAAYHWVVGRRWFRRITVVFFLAQAAATLLQAAILVPAAIPLVLAAALALFGAYGVARLYLGGRRELAAGIGIVTLTLMALPVLLVRADGGVPRLGLLGWGQLLFSVVPAALVLRGALRMRRSRRAAYRTFTRAVLIQIFVTQFFAFYLAQFSAAAGLIANILMLTLLRYALQEENRMATTPASARAAPASPGP